MKTTLCIFLLVALSGCAATQVPIDSAFLGKYNFGYVPDEGGAKAFIQVFDDGENMFIQPARSVVTAKITVQECNSDKPLDMRIENQFLIVPGIHAELCVSIERGKEKTSATILRCFSSASQPWMRSN